MKILLTAFEPFDRFPVNPTQAVADRLAAGPPTGVTLVVRHLPVVAEAAVAQALAAFDAERPDAMISLGLAGGRSFIEFERIAVNLDDYEVRDNAGTLVTDLTIVENGPTAYRTTLPVRAMERRLTDAGIPARMSYTAGTYICNHLFYSVQYHLKRRAPGCRYGFIHIPKTPDMGEPSLPLETMTRGIALCLETLRDTKEKDTWSHRPR
jgi:pyroglutamyl-peptidase